MRRMNCKRYVFLALCIIACMLLSCCAISAHTAGHACSHYDDCRFCRQLDAEHLLSLLALAMLSGCIFVRSRMTPSFDGARHCIVPVTLISQFIQMND